ncbi:hypothetical protein I317_01149 [Kwoniella heveanensis CBS 569]|nr:hypothetical protein I317_01149 [Kwoniella heveanensis CBS 569]
MPTPSPLPSGLPTFSPTPIDTAMLPNITRSGSSPLSSPSSSTAGASKPLPDLSDDHQAQDQQSPLYFQAAGSDGAAGANGVASGVINEDVGEMRSPATSSTLPLTDDEEDAGDIEEDEDQDRDQGGDDESELTEEDEAKGDRDMDIDTDMDMDADADPEFPVGSDDGWDEPVSADKKPQAGQQQISESSAKR